MALEGGPLDGLHTRLPPITQRVKGCATFGLCLPTGEVYAVLYGLADDGRWHFKEWIELEPPDAGDSCEGQRRSA